MGWGQRRRALVPRWLLGPTRLGGLVGRRCRRGVGGAEEALSSGLFLVAEAIRGSR